MGEVIEIDRERSLTAAIRSSMHYRRMWVQTELERRQARTDGFVGSMLMFIVGIVVGLIISDVADAEYHRGFQIGAYPAPVAERNKTIELAESYGANVVRYQIVDMDNVNRDNYRAWWSQEITNVIASAAFIKARGLKIKLIVDMHTPPFGTTRKKWGEKHLVLTRKGMSEWQNLWLEAISRIEATPHADVVVAYDLINEPAAKSSRQLWRRYEKLVAELRKVTAKPLIVSVARHDFEDIKKLKPLPFENIWYTFHTYKPHEITYHGIIPKYTQERMRQAASMLERNGTGKVRKWYRPARKFQKKWNVPIYVGEFGVSTEVPEPTRALAFKTTLDRFNQWGWHWTIHALNEYPLWQPKGESLKTIRRAM